MPSDTAKEKSFLKDYWQVLTLMGLGAVIMAIVLALYLPTLDTYAAWCAEQGGELVTRYQSPVCQIPE